MDAEKTTPTESSFTGKTAGLYVVWALSALASIFCIAMILPELVLVHQFHSLRDELAGSVNSINNEKFLNLLLDYSGNLSNWRAVCGFLGGIGGVAVWMIGQKPWFYYGGVLGALAFALNLLMMIWV